MDSIELDPDIIDIGEIDDNNFKLDMDEPDDWAVAEALHRAFVLNAS